ncbi:MAG TPA: N-acetyl-alpha-D-glucosaminyl L-malate synthase BshA [Acidobacteriota bacterium]|nr:N-acetyl-alpha-D-glucosaminyl L-malate synthase BshA [Acidobacteriota bacterium]
MEIGITCYPTYGGSGIVATELGQHLARRGHIVHFISSSLPNRLMELGDNIFFHEVEPMNYPLFEYVPYDLALATKMVDVASCHDLDLLHVHYAIPHAISGYLAREMMRPKCLPVITTLHGTDITLVGKDHSYLSITRFGIEQSDGVTAVSEFLRQATLEEFVDVDIRTIPNFVDVERVRRMESPELRSRFAPNGEKILVHTSNFRPVKRVQDVVHVFDKVQQQVPAVLLMMGDGVERSKAQHLARQLGLSKKIFFVGMVGMVESYLSICDLMLLPSETESFGLAALEAMACKVPVVATDVGGLPEVVTPAVNGFLSPLGDIADMAAKSLQILHPDNLTGFAERARQTAVERFSIDKVVPMYEKYYQEVLDRQPVGCS